MYKDLTTQLIANNFEFIKNLGEMMRMMANSMLALERRVRILEALAKEQYDIKSPSSIFKPSDAEWDAMINAFNEELANKGENNEN